MEWSPEAIVALIALLITGPVSLVPLWVHYRKHRGCALSDREQSATLLSLSEFEYTEYTERIVEDGLMDYSIPVKKSVCRRAIAKVQRSYRLFDTPYIFQPQEEQ